MKVEKIVVGYLEENCYIVSKGNLCLIVDPGDEFDKISGFIEKNNYIVKGILITHYHFDHIGCLKECKDKYKCEVYDYNSLGSKNVSDFNFEVTKTTGHSEDSVTFYFEKEHIMFVGDFIFKGNIGRVDLSGGSATEMIESIKLIKKYEEDITLYPGHGEATTLMEEKKYNPYFITENI